MGFLKWKQLEGCLGSMEAIRGFLQAVWVCSLSLGVWFLLVFIFHLRIVRLSGFLGFALSFLFFIYCCWWQELAESGDTWWLGLTKLFLVRAGQGTAG